MAGFFGKVPGHGDFITRDLARGFLDVWDGWLQACIAASRARLGQGWLDVYLTSPIWRFALSPGLCGAQGWAGILMPSVDRVGRYFPLTIAAPLAAGVRPTQLPAEPWFDAVEALALQALDDERVDANVLRTALGAIPDPAPTADAAEPSTPAGAWSLALVPVPAAGVAAGLAHALVVRQAAAYTLWWSLGSDAVRPAALVADKLPEPERFVELLHGLAGEARAFAPPPELGAGAQGAVG